MYNYFSTFKTTKQSNIIINNLVTDTLCYYIIITMEFVSVLIFQYVFRSAIKEGNNEVILEPVESVDKHLLKIIGRLYAYCPVIK